MSICTNDEAFYLAHQTELEEARRKFPNNNLLFPVLIEEVGELARALLEYEADECGWYRVIEEAVQVAVMAQRIATEGENVTQ